MNRKIKSVIKRILNIVNFYLTLRILDQKFYIPVVAGQGLLNIRDRESWLINVIDKVLRTKSGAVVDVGVNVGQTLLKVAAIDRDIHYLGFEPNILCAAYVHRLIEKNNLENYKIFPFGLGENDESVVLYLRDGQTETASVKKGFRPEQFYSTKMSVSIRRGDDLLARVLSDSLALVKIDVEGAELDVVRGMEGIIKQERPFILIEVLPNATSSAEFTLSNSEVIFREDRRSELYEIFMKLDYLVFRIDPNSAHLEAVTEFCREGSVDESNYLVVPKELKTALSGTETDVV